MRLQPLHRARRFLDSFSRYVPDPSREAELLAPLSPAERDLFDRFHPHDRKHALAVAAWIRSNCPQAEPWVSRAALLHDIGKTASQAPVLLRVFATLLGWLGAESRAEEWSGRKGLLGAVGTYLRYPDLGAEMLAGAGSDRRVAAWAAEHHLPEARWTVPLPEGRLLVAADDAH
jgi:hypothetical protein